MLPSAGLLNHASLPYLASLWLLDILGDNWVYLFLLFLFIRWLLIWDNDLDISLGEAFHCLVFLSLIVDIEANSVADGRVNKDVLQATLLQPAAKVDDKAGVGTVWDGFSARSFPIEDVSWLRAALLSHSKDVLVVAIDDVAEDNWVAE